MCWIKSYFISLQVFHKTLNSVVENVSKSSIFFMVTAEDRDEAVEFCQKNELCDPSHVIAPSSDKTVLYDTFYDTLERNMVTFLRDINAKASERHIHEIESLLGKLRSRKKTVKTMLTKQCLEKIKEYVIFIYVKNFKKNYFYNWNNIR